MFGNYLIGLREGLEASLVVCILVAYLVKTGHKDRLVPVWLGVGLVTWMVFWMKRTARHLKSELHGRLDAALAVGAGALVFTAFMAVGREGLETSLFIWTAVQATGDGVRPLIGALLGLMTSVVLGWMFYRGALKINLAKFFTWTGAMLAVVAAGVLAYGFHDLQEGGFLPGLHTLAFDISPTIPSDSWYGTLLKGVFNFQPDPTVLQSTVWALYVVPVMALFLAPPRGDSAAPAAGAAAETTKTG
ncbi:iron uptake transporter permease EfeU [Streptomyces roseus]|uniref:iron uptake transporter permease EfeU n=1 Tax=Streptomyces roseus TaxID=66430 RepID=UPI0036B2B44F